MWMSDEWRIYGTFPSNEIMDPSAMGLRAVEGKVNCYLV